MDYRIEVAEGDAIKTSFPDNRDKALTSARRLSRKTTELVYIVGVNADGDVGHLVYSDGRRCGADGDAI